MTYCLSFLKLLRMYTQNLLKFIGGQAAIARECDISDSAVSQWSADDNIPYARRQYLKLAYPGEHWIRYEEHLSTKAAKTEVA